MKKKKILREEKRKGLKKNKIEQRIKLKTTHKFVESQAAKAVVGQTI